MINPWGRETIGTHRNTEDVYAVTFRERDSNGNGHLETGDSVASVDYVRVYDADGNDLTTQYIGSGAQAPASSGNVVSFVKIAAASAAQQTVDRLELEIRVTTTEGRHPVWLDAADRLPVLEVEQ